MNDNVHLLTYNNIHNFAHSIKIYNDTSVIIFPEN